MTLITILKFFLILLNFFFYYYSYYLKIPIIGSKTKNPKENPLFTWQSAGNRIKTIWGENLDPTKVWSEYPRPQLEREEWTNLNGLWNYYLTKKGENKPDKEDGKILVPFPIESSLSGVMKTLSENDALWYEKKVIIKEEWRNKKHILLHFDAVDYFSEVFINNEKVGEHKGGYTPFYFDIKDFIDFNNVHFNITVKVIDPTDKGYQAVGKQSNLKDKHPIFYTPSSGIWQTVWIEALNIYYIKNIFINTDFEEKNIIIYPELNININQKISIILYFKDNVIYSNENHLTNQNNTIEIKDDEAFQPWSPDEPNLYNIEIILKDNNDEIIDYVKSYTAIRKISKEKDSKGNLRFKLNNKFIFPMGTLDQGFFPDGLYTPPSDEAQIYDIQKLKEMGFNTIRKHIKIENSRYYYHCDRLGMMVFQDMPSSQFRDRSVDWENFWDRFHFGGGVDMIRTQESKDNYFFEWKDIIDFCKFFQSIVIWIPFNEAWGQFDTEKVTKFTKEKDPTRLINSASGGNFRECGDIIDFHNYPEPISMFKRNGYVHIYGEFGGLTLFVKEHTWENTKYGYKDVESFEDLSNQYENIALTLEKLVANEGISAGIYTQTTDVERELNGLITYDRKVIKVNVDKIKKTNQNLINAIKFY